MVGSAVIKQGRSANRKHTYFFFLALMCFQNLSDPPFFANYSLMVILIEKQDQTLLWTCVAGAHLQCVNNHYAKF